jgi:hypothetical protein
MLRITFSISKILRVTFSLVFLIRGNLANFYEGKKRIGRQETTKQQVQGKFSRLKLL